MSDLYREVILEHWRDPQNKGSLSDATHRAFKNNPLCGDEMTIAMRVEDGIIVDVRFDGAGCAISTAAASLLTEDIKGKSIEDVLEMKNKDVVKLLCVRPGPARMKCAVLVLQTVQKAMLDNSGTL
jgi:nitrogen fixation protein NifU and related proteins